MTKPIKTAQFIPEALPAIVNQAMLALTRRSKDGQIEYRDHSFGWTKNIHEAYILSEHNIKHAPYYSALRPVEGGVLSRVNISIYDKDAVIPPLSATRDKTAVEERDYVVITRPSDAAGHTKKEGETFFLSHHGVYRDVTLLTIRSARAVVCAAAVIDRDDIGRLDMFSTMRLPGWRDCPHPPRFMAALRIVSIVPHVSRGPA